MIKGDGSSWCIVDQEDCISCQYQSSKCIPGLFSLLSPHIKSHDSTPTTTTSTTVNLSTSTISSESNPNSNNTTQETPPESSSSKKRKRNKKSSKNVSNNLNTGIDEEYLQLISEDYKLFLSSNKFQSKQVSEKKVIDSENEVDLIAWHETAKSMQQFSQEQQVLNIRPTSNVDENQLYNTFVNHNEGSEFSLNVFGASFLIPPKCSFVMSDIAQIRPVVENTPEEGYHLTVIDPPWENKSVKRSSKYQTLPNFHLFKLPVNHVCHESGIVAVWVTNKMKFIKFVKEDLFRHWGIQYLTTWHWLKVTNSGELPFPLDSPHKKPYEPIIIGVHQNSAHLNWEAIQQHLTIISVPGSHSRKPILKELFNCVLPGNANCLELFARNLNAGWTSWGNEVLKFQNEAYFMKRT